MKKLLTRGRVLVGAAVLVLAGVLLAVPAFAADPTPTPSTQQPSQQATPAAQPTATPYQKFVDALASKLGISSDQVTKAVAAVQTDEINQAVKDGKLTQAQADKMLQSLQNGPKGFGFGFMGGMMRGREMRGPQVFEGRGAKIAPQTIATFLGISVQDLQTAQKNGQSLAEIAQAHGKSRDDLKKAITDEVQAELNTQVTNGKLTQAQADTALKNLTDNLDKMIDAKPVQKAARPARKAAPQATPQATPAPQS